MRTDKAWTSKTMVKMYVGFIEDGSPSEGGGGWLDHRRCCSQLGDNSFNMHRSVLFLSAPSPSSAWPSLTVAATLLTSPFLSIPSTVLNSGVREIGQAVHWSLCQIEVKFEAEVSQDSVQSLHPLQRGIYGRALVTERTVCLYCAFAKAWLYFFHSLLLLLQASPTSLVFCWVRNGSSQGLINDTSSLIFMVQSHPDEAKPENISSN